MALARGWLVARDGSAVSGMMPLCRAALVEKRDRVVTGCGWLAARLSLLDGERRQISRRAWHRAAGARRTRLSVVVKADRDMMRAVGRVELWDAGGRETERIALKRLM